MQDGFITRVKGWLAHPFTSDSMTAFDWLLFVGLVIIAVFFWTRVLRLMVEVV